MTLEIGLLLAVIVASLICLSFDWFPADVVGLGVVLALILTGLLPPEKAFAGFGNETVIMILCLLIMTVALAKAGVVDWVGRNIVRFTGERPRLGMIAIMTGVALLSSFISNTASTAFFVPIVIGLAARTKTPASKLLLPVAFSSILASSVTLISTSTNLIISGLMVTSGLAPMRMFELTPVGVPILVIGLLYMFLIGNRMIPNRENSDELIESFGMRPYLTEILILPDSPLVGKSLEQSGLGSALDLTVLKVVRNKTEYLVPTGDMPLRANDVLLVEGAAEEVLKVKDITGIEIKADVKLSDPNLQDEDITLVEALVLPRSPLIDRTLKKTRFRDRYGMQVLAMNRHGKNVLRKISQIPLRAGDVLLLQGHRKGISAMQDDPGFRILGAIEDARFDRRKAILSIGIFVGALLLGTFQVVSFPVAVLIGAFSIFLSRCITPEEAYRHLEWKVVILIACMLSLGAAMEGTGADKYLAQLLLTHTASIGPIGLLSGFFFMTVALTQPMSNQAAAAVILPVAVETANQLGLNPRTFVMMVAVAASCSYLTPLEPSCLLVYGPGRYRFSDFLRVGAGLTILLFIIAILLVPRVWPLK